MPSLRSSTVGLVAIGLAALPAALVGEEPASRSPGEKPPIASPSEAPQISAPTTKPLKLKLPAGTKLLLPALAALPARPEQTLAGFSVTYPVYTGPGRLKNYRLTIELPAGKKALLVGSATPLPAEAAATRFNVEIPQGTTLKFASVRLAPSSPQHTLATLPREQELELPAGVQFRPVTAGPTR